MMIRVSLQHNDDDDNGGDVDMLCSRWLRTMVMGNTLQGISLQHNDDDDDNGGDVDMWLFIYSNVG